MISNPFLSNSNSSGNVSNSQQGNSVHINRGMSGQEKAEAIKSLSSDMTARLNRIKYLNQRSQELLEDISDDSMVGTSRLDQLARQLNADF